MTCSTPVFGPVDTQELRSPGAVGVEVKAGEVVLFVNLGNEGERMYGPVGQLSERDGLSTAGVEVVPAVQIVPVARVLQALGLSKWKGQYLERFGLRLYGEPEGLDQLPDDEGAEKDSLLHLLRADRILPPTALGEISQIPVMALASFE